MLYMQSPLRPLDTFLCCQRQLLVLLILLVLAGCVAPPASRPTETIPSPATQPTATTAVSNSVAARPTKAPTATLASQRQPTAAASHQADPDPVMLLNEEGGFQLEAM